MNSCVRTISFLSVLAVFTACASTEVSQQTPIANKVISQPKEIWVYDFGATDIASASGQNDSGGYAILPATEQVKDGRQPGRLVAHYLVTNIQAMGLPAAQARPDLSLQLGDGEIRGYVVSADDGDLVRRFIIGFGEGRSEMDTLAEYYVMTQQGLRKLGSWELSSSGSKTPGIWVPVVTAIALGNPLHLIFSTGMRIYGEESGRFTLEGRAKATATTLAGQLRTAFQDWGWISCRQQWNSDEFYGQWVQRALAMTGADSAACARRVS
jgi:hypothetical protein